MSSFLRYTFMILGAMTLTLILYEAVMGDTGRKAIWSGVEPTFQVIWNRETLNDGWKREGVLTDNFSKVQEVGINAWLY